MVRETFSQLQDSAVVYRL